MSSPTTTYFMGDIFHANFTPTFTYTYPLGAISLCAGLLNFAFIIQNSLPLLSILPVPLA